MEPSTPADIARRRVDVLRLIIDVLRDELSIVAQRRWDDLPLLKRRKVILASRLGVLSAGLEKTALPEELLIQQLEAELRPQVQAQIDFAGRQIVALQDLRQYWLECLSITFAKLC